MSDWNPVRYARGFMRLVNRGPVGRWSVGQATRGRVTVLLYHRIAEHDDMPWLEASSLPYTAPGAFRNQLKFLRSLGARFLTFDEIEAGEFPEPHESAFVISFDDGYSDNFDIAQSTLDEFGIRAVFFVSTSLPDQEPIWDHRLGWLWSQREARNRLIALAKGVLQSKDALSNPIRSIRYLMPSDDIETLLEEVESMHEPLPSGVVRELYSTWDQIVAASRAGHQIGSHGARHLMRHTMGQQDFVAELEESKMQLEVRLGNVSAFAYPFNSYLFGDEELCARVGFRQVATVDPGRIGERSVMLRIPRRTVFGVHDSIPRFCELLIERGFVD